MTWLIHMCDMTHSYVWHDSFICVTWLIHMCDMAISYVWRVTRPILPLTRLIYLCDVRSGVIICGTWLFHMCDMTHSYVWHDSFVCVTRLTHTCDMTHSYAWPDELTCVTWLIHITDTYTCTGHWMRSSGFYSLICVTGLIHMCAHIRDSTYSYVWPDWLTCVTWPIHITRTYTLTSRWMRSSGFVSLICVTWLIHMCVHMCDMNHSYLCLHIWYASFICVTWRTHMSDMTYSYY